jgi:hypothetical protein
MEGDSMTTSIPQLDYYYGREVIAVEEGEGELDGTWDIVLDGNVRIRNLNAEYDPPDETLVGRRLTTATFSRTQTQAIFGDKENPQRVRVNFAPTEYAIVDAVYGGEPISPQSAAEEHDALLAEAPEEPVDRIVAEPTEEALLDQEERAKALADTEAAEGRSEDERDSEEGK